MGAIFGLFEPRAVVAGVVCGRMSLLSLNPTFTQGFILGQISILILLGYVLRYLFFDTSGPQLIPEGSEGEQDVQLDSPRGSIKAQPLNPPSQEKSDLTVLEYARRLTGSTESLEWFNFLLANIARSYREALRDGLPGSGGNEAARRKVERWAQRTLDAPYLSPVKVHSVSLGTSAPRLSNARVIHFDDELDETTVNFDVLYTDTLSMTLSTSLLFNYPSASFARLPISLSVSLSIFSAVVTLSPPTPDTPSFTLSLQPDFTLSLTQSSLMGSRAKLSDVPKVHQIIEDRIKAAFLAKTKAYRIALPKIGEQADATVPENQVYVHVE